MCVCLSKSHVFCVAAAQKLEQVQVVSSGDSGGVGSVLGWQQPNTGSVMEKRADKTLGRTILGCTNKEQERGAQMDFTLEVWEWEVTVNIQLSEL